MRRWQDRKYGTNKAAGAILASALTLLLGASTAAAEGTPCGPAAALLAKADTVGCSIEAFGSSVRVTFTAKQAGELGDVQARINGEQIEFDALARGQHVVAKFTPRNGRTELLAGNGLRASIGSDPVTVAGHRELERLLEGHRDAVLLIAAAGEVLANTTDRSAGSVADLRSLFTGGAPSIASYDSGCDPYPSVTGTAWDLITNPSTCFNAEMDAHRKCDDITRNYGRGCCRLGSCRSGWFGIRHVDGYLSSRSGGFAMRGTPGNPGGRLMLLVLGIGAILMGWKIVTAGAGWQREVKPLVA